MNPEEKRQELIDRLENLLDMAEERWGSLPRPGSSKAASHAAMMDMDLTANLFDWVSKLPVPSCPETAGWNNKALAAVESIADCLTDLVTGKLEIIYDND